MRNLHLRSRLYRIKHDVITKIHSIQGKPSLHFLHIGKTGGTAIQYVITKHSVSSRYTIYLHPHSFFLSYVPRGEKVFFFLRSPISRFISGFYSRQRKGQPRHISPWTENEKIAFGEFNTPNQLALALSSTDAAKNKIAKFAMKNISHVRSSYWKWFKNEAYFKSRLSDILFIGFQERLTEDFEIFKSRIGLPESAKLPIDDVLSHRNPKHLDKVLEKEAVANLKLWYEADFYFIELCKQFMKNQ